MILTAGVILTGYAGMISPRIAFWARPSHIDLPAAEARLMAQLSPGIEFDASKSRIVIHKSRRVLELWMDDQLIKSCKMALGGKPIGAKTSQGDGRTPEGEYIICSELDRSRFHLFLGLSYPNASDAKRGFDAGLINQDQLDTFMEAAEQGQHPDWSTKLGGAIGIHGGGVFRDWTLGCIAVTNEDIEEIWIATQKGTPVTIQP